MTFHENLFSTCYIPQNRHGKAKTLVFSGNLSLWTPKNETRYEHDANAHGIKSYHCAAC